MTKDLSGGELVEMGTADLAKLKPHPVLVPLADRQGVFASLYKCFTCSLEFIGLSWRSKRVEEIDYRCPECGGETGYHGTVTLNTRTNFALSFDPSGDGAVEIYNIMAILAKAAEA